MTTSKDSPTATSKDMTNARLAKQDEFYTQLRYIEEEMQYYREYFKGKIILCNCDDPRESNFYRFFANSFEFLGLKKLITTCYSTEGKAVWLEYNGEKDGDRVPDPEKIGVHPLKGDGDFRSPECIEFLKQADIVVTNPPFSLLRQYLAQLLEYDKKFLILGNMNVITCKDVFPLFKENKIWYGHSLHGGSIWFRIPDHYPMTATASKVGKDGKKYVSIKSIRWFTNLDHKHRPKELILHKSYEKEPEFFPKYDNYDAISVDSYKDIPGDYYGLIGVPISFMDYHCPEQFDIIGMNCVKNGEAHSHEKCVLNGRMKYVRMIIRRKK